MEVVINLIIIFIVVASVLKKFQELAKSEAKIQKPRPERKPTQMEPYEEATTAGKHFEAVEEDEFRTHVFREEQVSHEEEITEQRHPLGKYTKTLDEILAQMKAEMPKEESIYSTPGDIVKDSQDSIYKAPKEIVSDSGQDSVYNAPKDIISDLREKGAYSRERARAVPYSLKPGLSPQFGVNAVVNGLIMSEVLGRPVSMRSANDWW